MGDGYKHASPAPTSFFRDLSNQEEWSGGEGRGVGLRGFDVQRRRTTHSIADDASAVMNLCAFDLWFLFCRFAAGERPEYQLAFCFFIHLHYQSLVQTNTSD